MNEKTKYKGVFYDSKKEAYLIQTTFTTKDGMHIKKCKRGFITLEEAYTWKMETALDFKRRSYKEIANDQSSVALYIDEYIKFKSLSLKPATIFQTKNILTKYFLPAFNKDLKMITINDISCFYQSVAELKIKNNSKNLIIKKVLGFVEYLDLMEYITDDLSRKYRRVLQKFDISMISNNSNFLEKNEYKKFIASFDDSQRIYKLLFNILYFTGARIGEVLALKFSDLDYKRNTLTFNKQVQHFSQKIIGLDDSSFDNNYVLPYTKTNSIKNVKIPKWLSDEIKENEIKKDSYVFMVNDNFLSRISIRYVLNKHLDLAGVKRVRIHDFRHSHITNLYDMGCDGKYVAERVGHSSELTSRKVYQHLTKNKKKKNDLIVSKMNI